MCDVCVLCFFFKAWEEFEGGMTKKNTTYIAPNDHKHKRNRDHQKKQEVGKWFED